MTITRKLCCLGVHFASILLCKRSVDSFTTLPITFSASVQKLRQLLVQTKPIARPSLLTTLLSTTTQLHVQSGTNTSPTEKNDDGTAHDSSVFTIQILMSDTGGGHRASANAIRDALRYLHGDRIQCDIVDIYTEYGPIWPYNDYPNQYKMLASNPWSWQLFYTFGATEWGMAMNNFLLHLFCYDAFKQCLKRGQTCRADMVVSVHPLTQDLPLKIIRQLDTLEGRQTPFCTVVTDLGSAHPTWFCPGVDKCFVPSDVLHQIARERGLNDNQIVQHGLPVRQGFWSVGSRSTSTAVATKETRRSYLNLIPGRPNVLVVGGGDGMGGIVDIARELGKELAKSSCECQLSVVCGKNEKAKKELENGMEWGLPTQILGFVNNMDEWMRASDVLVTKAGPGTIAEASICGLPCQEEGNIPFVETSGFGQYSSNPREIAQTVTSWLADPKLLSQMQECAKNAARPQATIDIARDLATFVLKQEEWIEQNELVEKNKDLVEQK